MRIPLLAVACLLLQTASARQNNTRLLTKLDSLYVPPATLAEPEEPQARLVNTLPNGNKVYALPQDNMPCIVPAAPVTMPVLGKTANQGFYHNYRMPVLGLRKKPLIPGSEITPLVKNNQ